METTYHEWSGYDFVRKYEFAGYGKDANAIYFVYETKYSIAEGVVYADKCIGTCNARREPESLVVSVG